MTDTLGILLEILNNCLCTRLSVRIIGVIKRQFFHMVTYLFDNSNLPQEIFTFDTWGAVIYSLGHGRKRMLTIRPTIWKPGLRSTGSISRGSFQIYFLQSYQRYNHEIWTVDAETLPMLCQIAQHRMILDSNRKDVFTENKAVINGETVQIYCSISQPRFKISKNPSVTRCSIWCKLLNSF